MSNENKNKIKVGLVIDGFYPHIDGVVITVLNYIKFLKETCDVTLITSRPLNKKDLAYYDNLDCKVILCPTLPVIKLQGNPVPIVTKKFLNKVLSENFDCLHIHSLFTIANTILKKLKSKMPNTLFITTMHARYISDFNRYLPNFISKMLFKNIVKRINDCHTVFNINKKMEEFYVNSGVTTKSIIVENGTSLEMPESLKGKQKEYNNNLLFVGRLIQGKGIFLIAKALGILKQNGIQCTMHFVGEGPDSNKLKKLCKKLGIENQVVFYGKITDREKIAQLYFDSSLFLFPSFYDCDCLVKREAAMFNTPTIFVEDTITSSGIIDNQNGFLTKNCQNDFAQKLTELLNNKQLISKVGEQANKSLTLSWKQTIENASNIYKTQIQELKKAID
ncbi:MAG: glycosyltransferase [Firmicutes bacterium]|nr:glycosyltransferase [Bacillota bacterium]